MAISKKVKKFDAIEMKRRIQAQIYEETKNMTTEEYVAYIHDRVRNGPFAHIFYPETAGQATPQVKEDREPYRSDIEDEPGNTDKESTS